MSGRFSWNLLTDLRDMWSYLAIVNAFRAGAIVAVLGAVAGWFMVVRRQSFAGHTLAVVGFPGAAAAAWLGIGVTYGYFAFGILAALGVAVLPRRSGRGYLEESAVVGTVQAVTLALGMLFVALYQGFLGGTSALLFGSFLGVTGRQTAALAVVAVVALVVLAVVGRPLLFASVDGDVAGAHGVPVRALGAVFLVLLGVTTAAVSQITGSLLVFALLILPPATAHLVTAAPARGLLLSVALGVATVWVALFVAYYSPYPIGFWLTSIAFAVYVLTRAVIAPRSRVPAVAAAGA